MTDQHPLRRELGIEAADEMFLEQHDKYTLVFQRLGARLQILQSGSVTLFPTKARTRLA